MGLAMIIPYFLFYFCRKINYFRNILVPFALFIFDLWYYRERLQGRRAALYNAHGNYLFYLPVFYSNRKVFRNGF